MEEINAARAAAISALRVAIEGGYRDVGHIQDYGDLDPIRAHPGFLLLMQDAAFPGDVFAGVER